MDAQRFLTEFGHIANAPGGVRRLRELVLSLAFRGDLCPNSTESIDALLKAIESQRQQSGFETRKQRLVRQGSGLDSAHGAYAIPKGWRWVSLSTVGHTWGQKKPATDFIYIDVSSVDNTHGRLSKTLQTLDAASAPSRARKIVKRGTLIYSTVRPYLLNIAIIDRDFDREPIASTAFAVVHPWEGVDCRYIYYYLRSPWFIKYVESVQIGVAYPAISDDKFYSGAVPLPPTEEQLRIVAKVDELMGLCDRLERKQQERRKLQNALRRSTLEALAAAASPHDLHTAWTRLATTFGHLFTAPEDVAELQSLVLDLAVRGKLVPQDPRDESAAKILDRLAQAGGSAVVRRGVSMSDDQPSQLGDHRPLPNGWRLERVSKLLRLGALLDLKDGNHGANHPKVADFVREGLPFITAAQVTEGGHINYDSAYKLSGTPLSKLRVGFAQPGDVIYTHKGTVGRVALCDRDCVLSPQTTYYRPNTSVFFAPFLRIALLADIFRNQANDIKKQTTRDFVSIQKQYEFYLIVPPLAEQHRVVAKVDELMAQCAEWRRQLERKQSLASLLGNAAVASLTGISISQPEDAPVKAPETELIAPLRLSQSPPPIKAQAPLASLLAQHEGEMSARELWQRSGRGIDDFYAQLKTEVAHGWIAEPGVAEVRESPAGPAPT